MSQGVEVTLGGATLRALPQPHAYLTHRLSAVLGAVFSADGEMTAEGIMRELGEGVYDVLAVLIPDLNKRLPAYEFHGYASKDDWKAGTYDEAAAMASPTIPEIANALETCIEVNGGEFFRKVFGFVDPKDVGAMVLEMMASQQTSSASLPATNGTSAPASSGETPPTLAAAAS